MTYRRRNVLVEKPLERIKKTLPRKPLRIFHPNVTDNLHAYFCIRRKKNGGSGVN